MKQEKTIFEEYFGESKEIKVMQVFAEWYAINLDIAHISEVTKISENEVSRIIHKFVSKKLIIRNEKRIPNVYRLNENNEISVCFEKLFRLIIFQEVKNKR